MRLLFKWKFWVPGKWCIQHLWLETNNLKWVRSSSLCNKQMQTSRPFIKVNYNPECLSDEHVGDCSVEKEHWSQTNKNWSAKMKKKTPFNQPQQHLNVSFIAAAAAAAAVRRLTCLSALLRCAVCVKEYPHKCQISLQNIALKRE